MTSRDIREKYIKFFVDKGHKEIAPAKLVPENDPTTLFTSSGMQPLVPYLLGQEHPEGKRLVDSQPSFRAEDIEEVGDNRHITFFEMLGNWSLGDYFKEDQIKWIWQFLTDENEGIGLDPNKLFITVFDGDENFSVIENGKRQKLKPDVVSIDAWKRTLNIIDSPDREGEKGFNPGIKIYTYNAKKNWWSRSGPPDKMPIGEIGGPDSEIFYDFGEELQLHKKSPFKDKNCHLNCDCGRFMEICNSVFIQYKKINERTFEELPNKNVDFGGGLERLTAATSDENDIFRCDLFFPIIEKICDQLGLEYGQNEQITASLRIVADHIKASVFLIKSGVEPSNKLQGYVLRRLLRRAAVKLHQISSQALIVLPKLVDPVLDIYEGTGYFETGDWDLIRQVVEGEMKRFETTLSKGL